MLFFMIKDKTTIISDAEFIHMDDRKKMKRYTLSEKIFSLRVNHEV